jgi:hypothetical protein
MSKWKNRPDGITVRRNTVAKFHSSRPVELLESPALRILSRAAHLALIRIEIELRHHAGKSNGKLIVTKEQFIKFGIHHDAIAPALRELDALGIISTEHGRGGNAEHRQPNRFLLNYLCGAVDAHGEITNAWKQFKTLEEAEQIAIAARAAKSRVMVAFGRRNARRRKNISRSRFPQNPVPETGTPCQSRKPVPLSKVSGRASATGLGHDQGPPLNEQDLRGMPRDLSFLASSRRRRLEDVSARWDGYWDSPERVSGWIRKERSNGLRTTR